MHMWHWLFPCSDIDSVISVYENIYYFHGLAVLQLKEVREGRLKKLKKGVLRLHCLLCAWHLSASAELGA